MEQKDLAQLEKDIKTKLGQTEKLLDKVKKFPDYGISEDDNILEIEEYNESLGLQKNLLRGRKELKRALKAIKRNRYGTCESCKTSINPERLKIYPTATLCVKCKSAQAKRKPWLQMPWRR
ncbi:MAG: hypothetical protein UR93_C0025G0007 [Berkelbacteria bacterium GW2011_GWA2_35_9]|uniref:Zinc finger DksA/TraR C4-type domain-containing protein n=1 Tax=Berkelbacteria bacterium GW2011_GWA2_35_9 TaxID=1618333 RepID=A0A0G0DGX2_9BACT|nr:MAG: hypothetical protein UR93_C0025G0007 [Berkelbacteria bacterium GW2011_GWA2_35_9]